MEWLGGTDFGKVWSIDVKNAITSDTEVVKKAMHLDGDNEAVTATSERVSGTATHRKSSLLKQVWRKYFDHVLFLGPTAEGSTYNPSNWYRKVFWGLVFVIAICASMYQVVKVVEKYVMFETTVTVKIGYEAQPFPSVTICNRNLFRQSQVNNTPEILQEYLNYVYTFAGDWDYLYTDPLFRFSNASQASGYGERALLDRDREELLFLTGMMNPRLRGAVGHQSENMILQCSMNGRKCSHKNFTHSFSRTFGNCFTFNSHGKRDSQLMAVKSGERLGLSLILQVQGHEYLTHVTRDKGLAVKIHTVGTMPNMEVDSIAVSPGLHTKLAMFGLNMMRIGGRYGKCGDHIEFEDNFGFVYTREGCLGVCEDRLIAMKCGCYRRDYVEFYPYNDIVNNSTRYCSGTRVPADCPCIAEAVKEVAMDLFDCGCPPPCKEKTYLVTQSSSTWPNVEFWDNIVRLTCRHDISSCEKLKSTPDFERLGVLRENVLSLAVYYSTMNQKSYDEKASYELSQFLSDLGGTAGLYLGASLFTLVELVEFFAYVLAQMCSRTPAK